MAVYPPAAGIELQILSPSASATTQKRIPRKAAAEQCYAFPWPCLGLANTEWSLCSHQFWGRNGTSHP
jgi:hypothetical protein